jgi:hypothetical protein
MCADQSRWGILFLLSFFGRVLYGITGTFGIVFQLLEERILFLLEGLVATGEIRCESVAGCEIVSTPSNA